jgi:putative glycosyltransferase
MAISIVTTLYKSEPYIDAFVLRTKALMGDHDELIIVDDGSPDDSPEIARRHASNDRRIVLVELSRNFGHHPAILAGLSLTQNDRIFLVDSDLEEEPELLREFSSVMDASGVDVVFGIHDHSQASMSRKLTSKVFWRLFSSMTDTNMPLNICNVRLMNRRYVDALLSLPERNVFLGGMFYWVGFKQIAVPVNRKTRSTASTYSIAARIGLAVRSVVSFSTVPLKAMLWAGAAISTLSLLLAMYYVVLKLLDPNIQLGFTTLIISIWLLSGIIIGCLGVIGVYLAYVYTEIKHRPRTVVREITRTPRT